VTIKANPQAITNSGLSSFYLESLERDPELGHCGVTYGALATLNNDVLTLGTKLFGTFPRIVRIRWIQRIQAFRL